MSTSLTTQPAPESSPMTLLAGMNLSSVEPDKLEKLLEVQAKWEDRQAEKALAAALANFQRDSPSITKTRKSHTGMFASLDDIMFAIRGALADNGLSVSFDTGIPTDGSLSVTCHVMHSEGARFNRTVTVPVDQAMKVNDTQKMGSAISYCKRYSIIAALNLIVSDHDDDGLAAGTDYVTKEQADELAALVRNTPQGTLEALLEWAACDSLADIPAAKFNGAKKALNAKQIKP